ncbi:MAG: DUF4445 domain-containing protein [Deltaproteobacteria bacterium]|nr:DUF4445 domain-containing protein [Deltaproteobacteria bacterium]
MSHLLRSKAAVFASIQLMMDYVGLTSKEIDTFYVADGLDSYHDIPKTIGVGLLPDIDQDKIRFVGNSSHWAPVCASYQATSWSAPFRSKGA